MARQNELLNFIFFDDKRTYILSPHGYLSNWLDGLHPTVVMVMEALELMRQELVSAYTREEEKMANDWPQRQAEKAAKNEASTDTDTGSDISPIPFSVGRDVGIRMADAVSIILEDILVDGTDLELLIDDQARARRDAAEAKKRPASPELVASADVLSHEADDKGNTEPPAARVAASLQPRRGGGVIRSSILVISNS